MTRREAEPIKDLPSSLDARGPESRITSSKSRSSGLRVSEVVLRRSFRRGIPNQPKIIETERAELDTTHMQSINLSILLSGWEMIAVWRQTHRRRRRRLDRRSSGALQPLVLQLKSPSLNHTLRLRKEFLVLQDPCKARVLVMCREGPNNSS